MQHDDLSANSCVPQVHDRPENRVWEIEHPLLSHTTPPYGCNRPRRQAVDNMAQRSPRQLYFSADNCDREGGGGGDSAKAQPWSGSNDGGAHLAAAHHLRLGLHGDKLRSDAYLRQALTSPYNHRTKQTTASSSASPHRSHGASGSPPRFSPSRSHHLQAVSDSSAGPPKDSPRDKREAAVIGCSPRLHHSGGGGGATEQHAVFKTPRSASGFLSPVSSASSSSGGSGSRHHPHHNPFEGGHDRLHFPVYSPGMFHGASTPASVENGSFRWDPEHLAELRPVHIDDKDIKRQLSRTSPDYELEERAQQAIDYYFAHHMVAPSPWGQDPPPHVLPVTPAYAKGYMVSTPSETHGSIQKELTRSRKTKDSSCQTTLTLPADFDIQKVLGDYMTHQETDDGNGENMSTSSLRRKLFFNADSSSIFSPVKNGKESPDHMAEALLSPPPFTPNRKTTPEWERGSPVNTPSSIQFSSSPIRGPYYGDGEFLRCSFSDQGALASPELSPIEKPRPIMRRFISMESDDGGEHLDDVDIAFGDGVRQQLQMEIHDGTSPPPCRPSPNVSPIAFSGTDTSHTSRSRTLRAEPSPSTSIKNESLEKSRVSGSSQPPLPFTSFGVGAATANSACVSMDTEPCDNHDPQGQCRSLRDSSMTDVLDGEGGSGLDTLQHPSSLSNQDTGYQTASGSGSLQTTQQDGLHHVSNDAGVASGNFDSSSHSASAETKLHLKSEDGSQPSGDMETGAHFTSLKNSPRSRAAMSKGQLTNCDTSAGPFSINETGLSEKMVAEDSIASPSLDPEKGASHTNLTGQFFSMPFQSELSVESATLETSMQSSFDGGVDSQSLRRWMSKKDRLKLPDTHQETVSDRTYTVNSLLGSGGSNAGASTSFRNNHSEENGGMQSGAATGSHLRARESLCEEDITFLTESENLYKQDAKFLERVAEYLEKDPSSGHHTQLDVVHSGAGTSDRFESSFQSNSANTRKTRIEDSVLERARNYLATVTSVGSSSSSVLGAADGGESGGNVVSASRFSASPRSLASTTPTKIMLGRVAEDLASKLGGSGSPALASDVAKEILRRAEEDLHSLKSRHAADGTH
ncbi:hypothetical protein BaRGS_00022090 [Batillaria attramentaria]|uniref:Protein aurora borealis n=1 Tax=Batillaria attramentaria TaxID=370345 RepID=A0ABD0KHQ0_9CAEN